MNENVYPYKTSDGHRSILEAISRFDAAHWLNKGTVFCEVKKPKDFSEIYFRSNFKDIVDRYLNQNKNFKAKG